MQAHILRNLALHLLEHYDIALGHLEPLADYVSEQRCIYRVVSKEGESYMLRALKGNVRKELQAEAAVLEYLDRRAFPAPHVLLTRANEPVSSHGGWHGLLLTWIKGSMADFSEQTLLRLGTLLARLHTLSQRVETESDGALLPDSRLRSTQFPQRILNQVEQELASMPQEIRPFYGELLASVRRIQHASPELPVTLIHGECWPHTALLQGQGEPVLIDWKGAGLAPAVLDVGYLLLAAHFGKPQLPVMQPDPGKITAIVRGYCQERRLLDSELHALPDAIRLDIAQQAVQPELRLTLFGNWRENITLQKLLARFEASAEIARIAQEQFATGSVV
ncbi:Ser/Thr protein kinase RdoA (MazF antagonist) [Thermosporothrix hazakensis]|jgi:Ser/Thr protein kinase RdoA (MazF antagonist)|uniref:Ser/Thr protein kinase RdoA (MazF antagonist) n=1 Tax=Thermosporothrix hazakensis TaxID=644383 RepID=A0A326U486_THEHA|nr:phosphotransferase [Thermosporothrix hazakensis]PZW27479.1 Ser/Thr protein kinase RdoA (MazF antagonist) [Thermosporothrix hazakensis]GCE45645.1 hypothetical protein KTH_05140 [Thermosporothrix hazakensis]